MKICLINNLYSPYTKGGAERIVSTTLDELGALGHDVTVITTKPYFVEKDNKSEFNIYRLRSLYWNLPDIPYVFRAFWHVWDNFNIINYFLVQSILKEEKPDVVFTHNLKGLGFLLPRAINKLNIKTIHTLHDIQLLHPSGLLHLAKESVIDRSFASLYAKINIFLFSKVDLVISPSSWLLKMHTNKNFFTNIKQEVLLNPCKNETAHLSSIKKIENQVLFVGQIESHKGIFDLIKAFKQVDKKYNLVIIGDGSQTKNLEKTIKDHENISYIGKVNASEVAIKMRESALLVVPSKCYENSPTVIYEAYLARVRVIASNIGGINEIVQSDFLFKAGDIVDLENKIKGNFERRDVSLKDVFKFNPTNMNSQSYTKAIIDLIVGG
ncbi:glycosyltransferase [Patescibacteria group bacterium]|nr:glycosyltransferase [Patescibacteria group bacterium]